MTSLSRKQFASIQTARGLTNDEVIARSGIPPQSFMVLMSEDGANGRDASKLISEATLHRLAMVLGLAPGLAGLRMGSVIEWRASPKKKKELAIWEAAVSDLHDELFTNCHIDMAIIHRNSRAMFGKKESMVFIHATPVGEGRNSNNDVKLAITNANPKIAEFVRHTFDVTKARTVQMDSAEFDFTGKLISNGVYRANQFLIVLGGRSVRYTWADVQAAAKEFNFTTDHLIELIVDTVRRRAAVAPPSTVAPAIQPVADSETQEESRPALRVAVSG